MTSHERTKNDFLIFIDLYIFWRLRVYWPSVHLTLKISEFRERYNIRIQPDLVVLYVSNKRAVAVPKMDLSSVCLFEQSNLYYHDSDDEFIQLIHTGRAARSIPESQKQ